MAMLPHAFMAMNVYRSLSRPILCGGSSKLTSSKFGASDPMMLMPIVQRTSNSLQLRLCSSNQQGVPDNQTCPDVLTSEERGLGISSSKDCPEKGCAPKAPTVDKEGKVILTIYYDNDGADVKKWNAEMIKKACAAKDLFPPERFQVEFVVGAGLWIDKNGKYFAKYDLDADRREGCIAKLSNDTQKFINFVCCNNTGGTDEECATKAGINAATLSSCINSQESDKILIANRDKRLKAEIPYCHLPEFAFNGVVNGCIRIPEFIDLKNAICDIFKKGNIPIKACEA